MSRSMLVALLAISTMATACSNSDRSKVEATGNKPYSSTDVAADNTAKNKVDKDGMVPEPMDQGTSEADVTITTVLRQAITSDKSLSMNAKNVKIVTRDGVVTLRGPVETAAERTGIEAAANAIAGVQRVDCYLEVTGG
ncbi:MAG: BON domain-containing protein [Candidatus Eisenbacteria bacterium]|nr:BON domain-containing protein [Candidatus Eisenbacteria bacterium]